LSLLPSRSELMVDLSLASSTFALSLGSLNSDFAFTIP